MARHLTPDQVAEMRRRVAAGDFLEDVARDLGVTVPCVSKRTRGLSPLSPVAKRSRAQAARKGVALAVDQVAAYLALRKAMPDLTTEEAANSIRRAA
ncbi:hypothetical protein ACFOYU_11770 [Microvirga sp. GCM10011540]|uniref:hypothetical protein n=1 Tax=Microvirga sp. GCM10011540 TaxID=3317338 RepID=UPI003619ACA0